MSSARACPPGSRRAVLPIRLALISGVLVAATLIFVIALMLGLARMHLVREMDYRLLATVQAFAQGPARYVTVPQDLGREAGTWLADLGTSPDEEVLIRTLEGIVYASAGGLDLRHVRGARELLLAEGVMWRVLDGPAGRVRAVAVPLMLEGRQIGTIVAAASEDRIAATMYAVAWRSAAAGGVGMVLALVAAYAVMRSSLRPLSGMLSEIASIQETGDLTRRITHTATDDEIGRLAQAFDRMLERLESIFRSQRRFIADASHELRTPLAVARGHHELLRDEIEGARGHQSLAVVTEELDRMARIVDDLLLLAHLDEGIKIATKPVEVELVLREAMLRALLLAPPCLPAGRRQIEVETAPGLYASADPERLLQVLTNLIVNAATHGGEQAAITLRTRRDGGRVVIEVHDTGQGIPAIEVPHVFERFYRGASTRSASGAVPAGRQGVGLGLAIVASLVKAMGGEVSVRSAPGEGTAFAVVLPVADTL
jgi:signal transduction histidine kinase